jgi:hypothetical protein
LFSFPYAMNYPSSSIWTLGDSSLQQVMRPIA